MRIGLVSIVNSSKYQDLLEERDCLIRANERLRTDIQSLEERFKKSQDMGRENNKVLCYLMDFYYTVQESLKKAYPSVQEYADGKD